MMNGQTKIYFQKTGILLAVYLALRFLLPLVLPFFLSWLTVSFLALIREKLPVRLFPLSICYLAACLFLACAAGACACYLLYEPCRELFPACQSWMERISECPEWFSSLLGAQLDDVMPSAFSILFGCFLYLISVLLFARDWESFNLLLMGLPFAEPLRNAGKRIARSVKGWAKAQGRIMAVISVQCAVGYYLLRIRGFLFWAMLTGLVDALPVFGTGTVFVPWIFIVLLRGDRRTALCLAALYAVTWLTRELLEPKLVGDGLGLMPVCFLISVIVGLKLFGAIGLFTGPFGVLLVKELWAELERSAPPGNT